MQYTSINDPESQYPKIYENISNPVQGGPPLMMPVLTAKPSGVKGLSEYELSKIQHLNVVSYVIMIIINATSSIFSKKSLPEIVA